MSESALGALLAPVAGRQLVAGSWVGADDGATFDVLDPRTGEVIARVPLSGRHETARAVEAAHIAYLAWRSVPGRDRGRLLNRVAGLIEERCEDLAAIIHREQGKPMAEARGEMAQSASYFAWFAGEAARMYGDVLPTDRPDRRLSVVKRPVGVVGAITPWNFPSSMAARKLAPALAAGCAVVLKPAEATPLSAFALVRLMEEAGLPSGLVSVVTGDPAEIGAELTSNRLVRKITFTGSTRVGKLLARASVEGMQRTSLELGGNAAFCCFDDADLDRAVEGAINAKFRNAGQTCVAANRFLVQRRIHDEFVARLTARLEDIETAPEVGPLIDGAAVAKVRALVEDARERGADVTEHGMPADERRVPATIVVGATQEMKLAQEEVFGPVAPIFVFDTEDEALALANGTPYGLVAYVYTSSRRRAVRFTEELETGMVGINECAVAYEGAPFGGVKESGTGREGSRYGLDDYTELTYIAEAGLGGLD